jgi:hypothetical protein
VFKILIKLYLLPCVLCAPISAFANSALGIDAITVCMNFGCKAKQVIAINQNEWDGAANWFSLSAETAEQERNQIKKAVGWMEVIAGRHTPTHNDVGGNLSEGATFPGQLDCIDESLNTDTYLKLFELNGFLKHHKVVERAYRRAIFDQHWSGQIEEVDSGERWVVDSWFQNNGNLPYVQKSKLWEDIPLFTSILDNSQDNSEKQSWLKKVFN